METTRVTEINGKRYTFFFLDENDKGLAIIYTKGDESKKLGDITLVKPHFISKNHPVRYEITTHDPEHNNMRILARIQVDPIEEPSLEK